MAIPVTSATIFAAGNRTKPTSMIGQGNREPRQRLGRGQVVTTPMEVGS